MHLFKRLLTVALVAAILLGTGPRKPADAAETWAADTLQILVQMGLVDASLQSNPDAPLSRGLFATWVAQGSGLPPVRSAAPAYIDLPASDPIFPWVEALRQAGAVHGYPDGSFRSGVTVTRAQMAAVVVPLAGQMPTVMQAPRFSDLPPDHWAHQVIAVAASKGLVQGYPDGSFHPDETATVAHGAMVLLRLVTRNPNPNLTKIRLLLAGHSDAGSGGQTLSDGSGPGSALGAGLTRGRLITAGQMASILAQNYYGAPPRLAGSAALLILRDHGVPVHQQPDETLTVPEFKAWVEALRQQGLLAELAALDANPGTQPARFALDLQVVRSALDGTLLAKTAPLPDAAAQCLLPLGIQVDDPSGQVGTGILVDDALQPHASPKNQPPVAAFTVASPLFVGDDPQVTDLSYDPDGDVLTRTWIGRHPFTAPGTYSITLLVFDPSAASSQVTHTVEVQVRPKQPPVASFRIPNVIFAGDPVQYTDTSTDPNGDRIVQWDWQGRQASFATPGVYSVTLRVRSSSGLWSLPFTQTFTVLARPQATATSSFSPNPARRGEDAVLTVTPQVPASTQVLGVEVQVPGALQQVPVAFGNGQTVIVSNPSGPASGSGGAWTFRVNVPWSAQAVPNGLYTFTVTIRYRTYWSWDHIHYNYDADGNPILDENGNPTYWIHTHTGYTDWSQTDTVQLGVDGQIDVITPGSTGQ